MGHQGQYYGYALLAIAYIAIRYGPNQSTKGANR